MVAKLQMPLYFYAPGNVMTLGHLATDKFWREKFGRRWYHFVYRNVLFLVLNTEDPPGRGGYHLGDEQLAWAEQVLAQNRDVRWTIVSLHKPLWTQADVEKTGLPHTSRSALADRPYTVFCGHVAHRFPEVRPQWPQLLPACDHRGRQQSSGGVEEGEFDHFVWVTMKKEGPVLANVLLDAVLPGDLIPPETHEAGTVYARMPPRQPFQGKAFFEGAPMPGAVIEFIPSGGDDGARGVRADGIVQPDGSFTLSTLKANDGVVAGDYTVTATWRRPLFLPDGRKGPNQLPDRYAKAASTLPLRATPSFPGRTRRPWNCGNKKAGAATDQVRCRAGNNSIGRWLFGPDVTAWAAFHAAACASPAAVPGSRSRFCCNLRGCGA